jgi:hypothetical protein
MNLVTKIKQILSTPFPRQSFSLYIWIALFSGLSVAFILNVFQPFNTQNFNHPYKHLILSGYGIVIFLSVGAYYTLSYFGMYKRKQDKWTISRESVDLFLSLFLSLLCCYLYYSFVFDFAIKLNRIAGFLSRAASVAIVPISFQFLYMYWKYKGTVRSEVAISETKNRDTQQVILKGTNKGDLIETDIDDIIYIKAEDNYVILYLARDGSIQKHMIRGTMSKINEQLPDSKFYRCHRSYIINFHRIEELKGNKNSMKVILEKSAKVIPVSRSKVDTLKSLC